MDRIESFKNHYDTSSDRFEVDATLLLNTTSDIITINDGRGRFVEIDYYDASDLLMSLINVIHINNDDRIGLMSLLIEKLTK